MKKVKVHIKKNTRKKLIIFSLVSFGLFVLFQFLASSGEVDPNLHPTKQYSSWAFYIGVISAISLLFGSVAGILFTPRPSVTASMTAFGAGALLAALSVELIAPTVMEIVEHSHDHVANAKSHAIYTMGALLIGCVAGGILFVTLDEMLSNKGAFMRKVSTMLNYVTPKTLRKTHENPEEEKHLLEYTEIKEEVKEHNNAPMSIWLGLLIDGIPESFVIGAGFLSLLSMKIGAGIDPSFGEVIPYTLVAGLFLSNFPEALSSSIGMKKQGMSTTRILTLWGSLVLIIAIGSTVGYYIGSEVPHEIEISIEGLAAGAMLTMIAQTMIPEAVHIGGNRVVGLSTLAGYLSAVAFKLFE
jgi:zinc transporter ZupT